MNLAAFFRTLALAGAVLMSLPTAPAAAEPVNGPLTSSEKIEIAEAVTGIGLYADQRDWTRVEQFFAPQVTTDYVSLFGGEIATTGRSDLVAQWKSILPGFDATQHLIANLAIEGAGDQAGVTSHVRATHWLGDRFWTVGGVYSHRLVRTADGWRVTFIGIRRLYEEGDRTILELAGSRAAGEQVQ